MAPWGMLVALIGVLILATARATHPSDQEVSASLEAAIQEDSVVLTWTHIKTRSRRRNASAETLLALDFPGSDDTFVLALDRHEKKVVLDVTVDGLLQSQHWAVDPLSPEEPIKSMVLYLDQRQPGARARLYVDCETQGSLNLHHTPRDLYNRVESQTKSVRVSRERKHALEVHGAVRPNLVLEKLGCPKQDEDRMVAIEPDGSGRPGERGPQGNELYPNRGDIPILHGCDECDKDLLVKTLNDLINAMKRLREEVEYQRTETRQLREMLEQCELCKGNPSRRRLDWRPPRPDYPAVLGVDQVGPSGGVRARLTWGAPEGAPQGAPPRAAHGGHAPSRIAAAHRSYG